MSSGSAASRAVVEQAWAPVLAQAGHEGQQLGEQLLAVAHQIASHALAAPLTDPGRSGEDRAALARDLLEGRVDARVVELLQALVRHRWSAAVDLITALHDLGIQAVLAGARARGGLEAVEQELFAVSRLLEDDRELRRALEPSRRSRTADRVRLAEELLGQRLSEPAMSLVVWCVRHRAEGGVPRNLRRVVELAADLQDRVIADVVTAVPMTVTQQERLRAILVGRLGTDVEISASVDPAVIGSVRVTVRDHVVDATVRASLDSLRTALAS